MQKYSKKENAFQVFDSLTICINCQIKKNEMLFISSRLCQMDEQTSDDNDYLRFLFLFILNLINKVLVYSKK
jgi:hypothetical protein